VSSSHTRGLLTVLEGPCTDLPAEQCEPFVAQQCGEVAQALVLGTPALCRPIGTFGLLLLSSPSHQLWVTAVLCLRQPCWLRVISRESFSHTCAQRHTSTQTNTHPHKRTHTHTHAHTHSLHHTNLRTQHLADTTRHANTRCHRNVSSCV
jgi:hypothetical protein